jgi:hypothetical protein
MSLFEGVEIRASLRRNKIGRCGQIVQWLSLVSPSDPIKHQQVSKAVRIA